MKKIIEKIILIIMLILLVLVVYVLYQKIVLQEDVPKVFGFGILIVKTGSMEPEIKMGEIIIIKEEKEYDVRRCCNIY